MLALQRAVCSIPGIFNILSRIHQLQLTDHTHCSMESGINTVLGWNNFIPFIGYRCPDSILCFSEGGWVRFPS